MNLSCQLLFLFSFTGPSSLIVIYFHLSSRFIKESAKAYFNLSDLLEIMCRGIAPLLLFFTVSYKRISIRDDKSPSTIRQFQRTGGKTLVTLALLNILLRIRSNKHQGL